MPESGDVGERVRGGLQPGGTPVDGPDRGDHVHELGEARDPDAIGMTQEGHEKAADDERVGEILLVLGQRWGAAERTGLGHERLAGQVICDPPDVPLIDAQADPFGAAPFLRHGVGDPGDRDEHLVEVARAGQVLSDRVG